jgi:hemerythrin-like domain-containing protein
MNLPTPNLAQDLVRIHKVITRSIDVSLSKGKEYMQRGFADPTELAGYASYVHCMVTVLSSHHTGEDQIAFPELRKVIPSAPYSRLAAEHHQFSRQLDRLPAPITGLPAEAVNSTSTIVNALEMISNLWPSHYQSEERYFDEAAIQAVLSLEEQRSISQATSKHSQDHSEPAYWVVPFILYNLEYADRMTMAAFFPPQIMAELVPVVWKDRWAPMKPLLLD